MEKLFMNDSSILVHLSGMRNCADTIPLKRFSRMERTSKMIPRKYLLLLMLFTLAGCATADRTNLSTCGSPGVTCGWISSQGKNISDDRDMHEIETGYLDANMNYYYSGCSSLPGAIIKLNKDYVLDDDRWMRITDPMMLREYMRYIKTSERKEDGRKIRGFVIKANDGRPLGLWYAAEYVYSMRVVMHSKNRVYVKVPNTVHANILTKIPVNKRNGYYALSEVTRPPLSEMLRRKDEQKSNSFCQGCHGNKA